MPKENGLSAEAAGEAEPFPLTGVPKPVGLSAAGVGVVPKLKPPVFGASEGFAAVLPKLNGAFGASADFSAGAAVAPKLKGAFDVAAGLSVDGAPNPPNDGLSVAGAGVAAALPNENEALEASAGLSAAGAGTAEEVPKLKPPDFGASAGLAAGAPKLKGAFGVSADLSAAGVVEAAPKLNGPGTTVSGEAVIVVPNENGAGLTDSAGGLAAIPKSRATTGFAAAGGGVDDAPPKKLGTAPPDAGVDVGEGSLPRPVEGLDNGAKKLEAGGLPTGVVVPVGGVRAGVDETGAREKKPPGGDLGAVSTFSYDSGSAVTELPASGDDARGRLDNPELSRGRLVLRPTDGDGTDSEAVGCGTGAGGGTEMRDDSCGGASEFCFFSSSFFSVGAPNRGMEIPLNEVSGILVASSSSISGKSSSRAEKRPEPAPGLVARDEL